MNHWHDRICVSGISQVQADALVRDHLLDDTGSNIPVSPIAMHVNHTYSTSSSDWSDVKSIT